MTPDTRPTRPNPPKSPYFLSISRGDAIRTIVLAPALLWGFAALAPIAFGAAATGVGYIAFHRAPANALLARESGARRAAEAALADERSRAPNPADQASLETQLRELLSREARLERASAEVATLARTAVASAGPARTDGGALQAIEALSLSSRARAARESGARAYAPTPELTIQPMTKPERPAPRSADLSAADNPGLSFETRVNLARMALDRLEGGQMVSLAVIDRAARVASARRGAILMAAGLDPARLAAPRSGAPLAVAAPAPGAPPFTRAVARVADSVAAAGRLAAVLTTVPLRQPLSADATVSSPFGYRADPFLGRAMLHPGVDLIEGYGAEIHATASGVVVHAGPMGGYGVMVEIDHGNGLTTRYAHMSEVSVAEGEEVQPGDALGRVGSTGRSTGPHLHYEVRIDGEPVDPERFLKAGLRLTTVD